MHTHLPLDAVVPPPLDLGEADICLSVRAVGTAEAAFHFLKHATRSYTSCRAGARNASRQVGELYQLSTMMH